MYSCTLSFWHKCICPNWIGYRKNTQVLAQFNTQVYACCNQTGCNITPHHYNNIIIYFPCDLNLQCIIHAMRMHNSSNPGAHDAHARTKPTVNKHKKLWTRNPDSKICLVSSPVAWTAHTKPQDFNGFHVTIAMIMNPEKTSS